MPEPSLQHTIGKQKVSVTITRKTDGDLLVSQHSSERWYVSDEAAVKAMSKVLEVFIEPERSDAVLAEEEAHHENDVRTRR